MSSKRIDITVPLRHGMAHHPADPPISIVPLLCTDKGDVANVKHLSFSVHSGTHMDAPYHFLQHGKRADEYPPDFLCGRARVIDLTACGDIGRDDIAQQGIEHDDIVLLKTTGSAHMNDAHYYTAHQNVLASAAEFLIEAGIRAIGFDYLSIEEDPAFPAHRLLLGAGIPIIEGLCLKGVKAGLYRLTAMCMRIDDADGAPVRAVLEAYE